jgi:L-alanine-DL-glutamate epimerase-like enolase superfamily enzyme
VRIASVETRRYRVPWDPPLKVTWDPIPRASQEATVVVVRSDDGVEGYASGDALPDREQLERFLVGVDPLRTEVVRDVCETVDLSGGRPWTLEVAVWDLVGRALGTPCHKLLGGRNERLLAYASSCERVDGDERVRRCRALRDAGIRAVKIRLDAAGWRDDVDVIEQVRADLGSDLEIMVDANQGWRMPGDLQPRWDVATALECARRLERVGAYWLEEPLRTDDVEGYRSLRRRTDIRIAAGEFVRFASEARDLLVHGLVDVIQTDVVLIGGFGGCRRIAALAELAGRAWSPHTWSNGYGLLANLHGALAFSGMPYVEVPFDPPGLTAQRRDWLLPAPIEIAQDGTIAPPDGPGLGVVPDFDALEQWRIG